MAASFKRGVKGELVGLLQRGLAAGSFYTGNIDGDFGGNTEKAVMALQAQLGRPETGGVGEPEWTAATGLAFPSLFERCLQLTARFEGHGYGTLAGNFDDAGLTWGIIGFTLAHGELTAIVLEVDLRAPEVLVACFGENEATDLTQRLRNDSKADLVAWADGISRGPSKRTVDEPWRTGFMRLGASPLVREIQRREARSTYFDPAALTAQNLGLASDRGLALCFDIHVQNGGVKKVTREKYQAQVTTLPAGSGEAARLGLLAQLVAQSAKPQWRADVLARKDCIASGAGKVHGEWFDVASWGLA